jgi:pyruvate dehydrogenase E2 component (dihydrolipoamide acetyltransferase)
MTTADGDDFIGIRWMAYFALSFDHRVIDGADAERFLASSRSSWKQATFRLRVQKSEQTSAKFIADLHAER